MLSIFSAIITVIIPLLMAYVAYKYPFNTEDGKGSIAAKVFGILSILGILAGSFMVYSNSKDSTEIIKGEKDLQISQKDLKLSQKDLKLSQKDLKLSQKDLQISQLKLQINQKELNDSISYLTKLSNNQKRILDTIGVNAGISSSNLQNKLDLLKKSNDSLRAKEIDPLLDILPGDNPVLKASWHDSANVLVFLVSEVIEKAVATNIVWQVAFVSDNGSTLTYYNTVIHPIKSNFVHYEKGITLGCQINPKWEGFKSNKLYSCLKITYTNRNSEVQKPLIKMFAVTNKFDERFTPIYGDDFDRVVTFVKSKVKSF